MAPGGIGAPLDRAGVMFTGLSESCRLLPLMTVIVVLMGTNEHACARILATLKRM